METKITATELAKSLSDVLNRVRYRRESFLVERNGEAVAALTPSGPSSSVTLREVVAHFGNLEAPGEGFANDMEAVQSSQPKAKVPEWPS